MKKVLWISRHPMTEDQMSDLKRIYGEVSVSTVDRTLKDVAEIRDEVEASDVIAAVLPIDKMGDLKKLTGKKPVIRSVSERVATENFIKGAEGREEREYVFRHMYWEEIETIQVVSRRL